jgi:hypothetical protein
LLQGLFSILIFLLLSSQDGFSTEWKEDAKGVLRAPAIYNGASDGCRSSLRLSLLTQLYCKSYIHAAAQHCCHQSELHAKLP